jgi:hypothetical protein
MLSLRSADSEATAFSRDSIRNFLGLNLLMSLFREVESWSSLSLDLSLVMIDRHSYALEKMTLSHDVSEILPKSRQKIRAGIR